LYNNYLAEAQKLADHLSKTFTKDYAKFTTDEENELKWFEFKHQA